MNISAPGIIREKPSYGESQEEVEKKKRVFLPGFPRSLVLRVWSLEMATLASRGNQLEMQILSPTQGLQNQKL